MKVSKQDSREHAADPQGGSTQKVWPEKVVGAKYVRLLSGQLEALKLQDAHGNQKLFLDDVFVAYLLAFFNPAVRSLRTVEDFTQAPAVQPHLSLRKICKSTLADFQKLADPTRLEPIIHALRSELSRKYGPASGVSGPETQLQSLLSQTIAVDGTFLPALAKTTWAICNSNNHGTKKHRARLDVHLAVSTWLPEVIVVPEPGQSEADSAIGHLQPGKLYLYDRGFMSFALLMAHYQQADQQQTDAQLTEKAAKQDDPQQSASPLLQSYFVARYRPPGGNSPELQQVTSRELAPEDQAAGVISDRVGVFVPTERKYASLSGIRVREVTLAYQEQGESKTLRLITNVMDVSAEQIGLLYRMRWQVELFFRWLKTLANFGHLISCTPQGVLMHMYIAIIAILLMYLHTGYRPSKYLFALLSHVANGSATIEELMPILRERERQCERDRLSTAKRRENRRSAK